MTNELAQEEFSALRATIRERGTARVWLFWLTIAAWGSSVIAVLAFTPLPIASLVPLTILAAGFESVYALHIGVERIGRYLQVFAEPGTETRRPPAWEHTVMALGQVSNAPRTDPLFLGMFLLAAAIDLVPVVAAGPTALEGAAVGLAHVTFVARLLQARAHSRRQRIIDLKGFQTLRDRPTTRGPDEP